MFIFRLGPPNGMGSTTTARRSVQFTRAVSCIQEEDPALLKRFHFFTSLSVWAIIISSASDWVLMEAADSFYASSPGVGTVGVDWLESRARGAGGLHSTYYRVDSALRE